MHKATIVQNILNLSLETAEEYNAQKITEINVEIGKLNQITGDQLNFIFNILSKGTIAENANLYINETDASIKCYNCDFNGQIDKIDKEMIPMVLCPECGSHRVNVLDGNDIILGNITIEQ